MNEVRISVGAGWAGFWIMIGLICCALIFRDPIACTAGSPTACRMLEHTFVQLEAEELANEAK